MTILRSILLGALLAVVPVGAAPFQNFGFEEAQTNSLTHVDPSFFSPTTAFGSTTDLLPAWQLFQGDEEITMMSFNGSTWFGNTFQSIIDLNNPEGATVIEGRYSLLLTEGSGNEGDEPYFLTQRGDIPADADELTFRTTPAVPVAGGTSPSQLDAIAFVVPEPATVTLWVVGISALVGRWAWSWRRSLS